VTAKKKGATALCIASSAGELIIAWGTKELTVVDKDSGAIKRSTSALKHPARRIIATRDGQTLGVLAANELYLVRGERLIATRRAAYDLAWTKDERWLLTVNGDQLDRVDPATGERRASLALPLVVGAIAVTEERALLVSAADSNLYRLALPEEFFSE